MPDASQAERVRRVQADMLVRLGFPAAAAGADPSYGESVPPLPPRPPGRHGERFSLPVLIEPRLTLKVCLQKSRIAEFLSKSGGDRLLEARDAAPFAAGPYWIWCNTGAPYRGKSVAEVRDLLPPGERWLTATECVFLAIHHRDLLHDQPVFCAGSLFSREAEFDTAILLEPSAIGLTVDWTNVTNAHPRYGCASCAWPPDFAWDTVPAPGAEEQNTVEGRSSRPQGTAESAPGESDVGPAVSASADAAAVAQPTLHRVEMECAHRGTMEAPGTAAGETSPTTTGFAAEVSCPPWRGEGEACVTCPACSAEATVHLTERGTWNRSRQRALGTGIALVAGGTVTLVGLWCRAQWLGGWAAWRSLTWANPLCMVWALGVAGYFGFLGVTSLVTACTRDLLEVRFGRGEAAAAGKAAHSVCRHEGPPGSVARRVGLFGSLCGLPTWLGVCAGTVTTVFLVLGVGAAGKGTAVGLPVEPPAAAVAAPPEAGAPAVAIASPPVAPPATESPAVDPPSTPLAPPPGTETVPAAAALPAPAAAPAPPPGRGNGTGASPTGPSAGSAAALAASPSLPASVSSSPATQGGAHPASTGEPAGFRTWRDRKGQTAVATLIEVEVLAPVPDEKGRTSYTRLDGRAYRAQSTALAREPDQPRSWRAVNGSTVRARLADILITVVLEDRKGQVRKLRLQDLSAEDQAVVMKY